MHGSLASRGATIALIVAVLVLVTGLFEPLAGQSSSAEQAVSVAISPILSLAVSDVPAVFVLSSAGAQAAASPLQYDLTTNVRGAILEAGLSAVTPPGVEVSLSAETNHGTARGMVALNPDGATSALVVEIQPGLENNQRMWLSVQSDEHQELSSPVEGTFHLTLRDPSSGVSRTITKTFIVVGPDPPDTVE